VEQSRVIYFPLNRFGRICSALFRLAPDAIELSVMVIGKDGVKTELLDYANEGHAIAHLGR